MGIVLGSITFQTAVEDLLDVSEVKSIVSTYIREINEVCDTVVTKLAKLRADEKSLAAENFKLDNGQYLIEEALEPIVKELDQTYELETFQAEIIKEAKNRFFLEAEELQNQITKAREDLGKMMSVIYENALINNGKRIYSQKDNESMALIFNSLSKLDEREKKLTEKINMTNSL